MIRPWALIVATWWNAFHRSASDPMYAYLIWNETLRRVL